MEQSMIINSYQKELKRLGYGKGIILDYPKMVFSFLERVRKSAEAVEPSDIWQYYEYLQHRPNQRTEGFLSGSYINSNLIAIRLFYSYLQKIGLVSAHPMSVLVFPSFYKPERIVLTEKEIQSLYKVCENLKDKAILGIYYGCGLRRKEGELLNIRDISFKQKLLYVRKGKGAKRRVVPMSEQVSQDLKAYYIQERGKWVSTDTKGDHRDAFLLNSIGQRQRGDTSLKRLKYLVLQAEIEKDIGLHHLRHSIATHLLARGMKVEDVRDFLGHYHLESTQIYTRVLNHLIEAL